MRGDVELRRLELERLFESPMDFLERIFALTYFDGLGRGRFDQPDVRQRCLTAHVVRPGHLRRVSEERESLTAHLPDSTLDDVFHGSKGSWHGTSSFRAGHLSRYAAFNHAAHLFLDAS